MGKTALISGISGQTGSLLASRLLRHGYTVIGGSRDKNGTDWWRLEKLGILGDVQLTSIAPSDFHSVLTAIKRFSPDEIYYLGGQSSVALSFTQPFEAFESVAGGTLNFLEAIRISESPARFFNAASTDCFGDQSGTVLNENSPMKPISPYGVAKAASYWTTVNYRESFGIHASNGILTNHESPLRGKAFVTQKIISTLKKKKVNPKITLSLGNTSIRRDWLWAPEAAEAIHRITSHPAPGDFVVASGKSHSLHDLIEQVCIRLDIDPSDAYEVDEAFFRPDEIESVRLDPSLIHSQRGWSAQATFTDLVDNLLSGSL
jgi:GDPmannose 4,6-dehydratase